ncbi:hypothetical protein CUMW_061300 [Citrus unshiu]|uniref:UV radiation resistance protein/autophagy-related protein 14 n=1 Tax=Citrus unshiu TaxID=55188 RepID=A0A2H5NNC7_CITUN|nr:hypothetical protein CUMW_061300 [Citrus unshiu]
MNKKASNCAICENSNRASICAACVNYRLSECNTLLKSLKSRRDALYMRLSEVLVAKGKADDQLNWRVLQNEKLTNLREKLRRSKEQLSQGKLKIEKSSYDLKVRYAILDSARSMMEKNRAEQLEKFYPNIICTQSLGHMAIDSELLHKQSVVIKQICKLFPQRRVNIDGERRDGSSGQYDQICGARLPKGLDPHSVPSEELAASLGVPAREYGNGILIGMHVLLLEAMNIPCLFHAKIIVPPVEKILGLIEAQVTLVLLQWNPREGPNLILLEKNLSDNNLPSSAASFLYATEMSDIGKNESLIDGWDLVEHPTFPPPPSQTEDVEHWTRAMIIDATKK